MPQPRRAVAVPEPRKTVRLAPVPQPVHSDPGDRAHDLLKALEKLSVNGGTILADPPRKRYGFPGGVHINVSQQIQENLWRFGLGQMARDLLDHFAATHDETGLVKATQQSLGTYFGCHHSKVSRAIKVLDTHNFAWKYRQGQYQLNPTYAYRWGSRKQHALMARIKDVLDNREIKPPLSETRKNR